ncbi:copper amine oxidase N-terminal domain-containing protein [Paenibacillus sp. CAU 1782]
MKKIVSVLIFALLLSLIASPAYAAGLQIKIDDVAIKSDVKPETKNYRTMVPLRVISENLAAHVEWLDPEVKITKHDLEVTLKANSKTAIVNGKTIQMDVAPYIKNKHTFVPLRFISETFGYKVDYVSPTVTIETTPLIIEGKQIYAMQNEVRMTMGSIVSEITGNAYVEAFYHLFQQSKGKPVEAPLVQNRITGSVDPGSYTPGPQNDFLDKDGGSVLRLELYSLNNDFPAELLAPYPAWLLYDATADQWYEYQPDEAESFNQLFDAASQQGFLRTISNNVV